jgi:aminoacrylate hydrolase
MRATSTTAPPQLAHECIGEGDPIVLIAGLNGLGRFWQTVASALARGHRVLTFDHPGVGSSDNFGAQRIERIAAELLHLADRLDIARFACVGHSTGGLVAHALALDAPDRISALVLSCTWAPPDQRFRDLFELRRLVLNRAGLRAYALLGQLMGYPSTSYEHIAAARASTASPTKDAAEAALIDARIEMLLNYQRADELGTITQPTLIIAAPDDQIVPFNHAHDLATRIVHAELVALAGGHFVPVLRTAEYAAAIERFLNEHAPC